MTRRASPVGPIVMIVPLLSLIAGALWMRDRVTSGPPPAPPDVADPDEAVAGWRTAGEDRFLTAELFPLHALAERQAFEALVLAERLDLATGEPYRLRLSLTDPTVAVDPASIRVDVPAGTALAVVRPGPTAPSGPLRTLVAPPSALEPDGRIVDIVLWGRAPEAPASLCVRDVDGAEHAFALERLERPRRELPAFLARLDPEDAGKEPGPGASEGPGVDARPSDR